MNVVFVSAEVAPLIKVGGLADVAGALPGTLRELGHDVRIMMPFYRQLRHKQVAAGTPLLACFLSVGERQEQMRVYYTRLGDTPVYLLDIPAAFERDSIYGDGDDDRRFVLFARGVLALMLHLRDVEGWAIDLVHSNDWHTGLVPNYLKTFYTYTFGNAASVYTIHNLGYQGQFSPFTLHMSGLSENGMVESGIGLGDQFNFMARGLLYTDVISTVSPRYAQEILTPEFGYGLNGLLASRQDRLVGILNGIDYVAFDPATDPHIAAHYSADDTSGKQACKAALQAACGLAVDPNRPLLGAVTRLVEQKGLDLVDQALPWLMRETDAQVVILGTGQWHLEQAFLGHQRANPDRVRIELRFDAALAQQIYAGCDAFLMPSRYEPGGLGQLIALRYGTVPVVRATGGLEDTVREGYDGNGFRFHPYDARELIDALQRCLTAYRDQRGWPILRERGMREDHSWESSAREYVALYERALREIGR